MNRSRCTRCNGTGEIQHHRSRWIGGGKSGYRSEWTVTEPCTCTLDPEPTPPAGQISYFGATITAPGFTPESFQPSLNRARSRGTLPMIPAGAGVVLVESVRTGERYKVTRETCSCPGSQSHGRCMHRAACIAAADLYGIDPAHVHVLGFANGHPVPAADRVAGLEAQAA